MNKITIWLKSNEPLYRAMRTFFQAAMGVLATVLYNRYSGGENVAWDAVILLAVSTGLAAVMNASSYTSKVKESLSTLGISLQDITYESLLAFAESIGVEVASGDKKLDVVNKINEALLLGEKLEDDQEQEEDLDKKD